MVRSENTIRMVLVALVVLAAGCHLPHEPGPQPRWLNDQRYDPALNVFGLLHQRAGDSFVHVERTYKMEETTESLDSMNTVTQVSITRLSDSSVYYFEADTVSVENYHHATFAPVHGERYALLVTAEGLPTLTDTITMPPPVELAEGQVQVGDGKVSFELQEVEGLELYDVYLFARGAANDDTTSVGQQRLMSREDGGRLAVVLAYDADGETPLYVEIYGYDVNLADYGLAPVSIKPQTYNDDRSTVDGGFGCFGAVVTVRVAIP